MRSNVAVLGPAPLDAALERLGLSLSTHASAGRALRSLPDVVVVTGAHALEHVVELRRRSDVPVVVVGEVDALALRGPPAIAVLDAGADDWVPPTVPTAELAARLRAHARRARGDVGPAKRSLRRGPLVVDVATRSASLDGHTLALTSYEFALLQALAEQPGRVLSRESLVDIVRGSAEEAFDRSVDVHVSHLRAKLGDDPRRPRLIKTVRGAGYMLAAS